MENESMTENQPAGPEIEKILNESIAPLMEKISELEKQNAALIAAHDEFKKMNASAEEQIKELSAAKIELEAFKTERETEKESLKKESYKKRLNQAAQANFEEYYPEMLKDLAGWENSNVDKLFHPVEDTKLGGKSMNQPPADGKTLAHAALSKIGA